MQISDFARAAGLSADTVRFYVRSGLLRPRAGRRGGANPYQEFSAADLQTARLIRMAKSFGFTLREIAALNDEYQSAGIGPARQAAILRERLAALEARARELAVVASYLRAKLAWLDAGGVGPEPGLPDPHAASGGGGGASDGGGGGAAAAARGAAADLASSACSSIAHGSAQTSRLASPAGGPQRSRARMTKPRSVTPSSPR